MKLFQRRPKGVNNLKDKFGENISRSKPATIDLGDGQEAEISQKGIFKKVKKPHDPGKPQIFKLQRQLNNAPNTPPNILCYNEDKSYFGEFPASDELLAFFGERLKIYVIGSPDPFSGKLNITSAISDQGW